FRGNDKFSLFMQLLSNFSHMLNFLREHEKLEGVFMDIYNYLKKDHRRVSKLIEQIVEEENIDHRLNLFLKVQEELELHADPEDKTFYQALRKNSKGKKLIEHAEEEHDGIKSALKMINKVDPNDIALWFVALGQLKQIVEHHVKEEEGEIFKSSKKILSAKRAKELPEEMEELKNK